VAPTAWGCALIAIIVAIIYAFRPKAIVVECAIVRRADLVVTVDEVAKSRVRERFVIAAPVSGYLLRPSIHAGDIIAEGQVVARLAPSRPTPLDHRSVAEAAARVAAAEARERQAAAVVEAAQLNMRHTSKEYAKTKQLAAAGALSDSALLNAEREFRVRSSEAASAAFAQKAAVYEAAVARAVARPVQSQTSLSAGDVTNVLAPTRGVVLSLTRPSEGPVVAGAALLELGDLASVEVVADVLTGDAVRIANGAHVTLTGWGGPPAPAHVRRIEPSAFTHVSSLGIEEQRVAVVIDFNNDVPLAAGPQPHPRVGDGYRLEASIVVAQRPNVIAAPVGAIVRRGDQSAVFRLDRGRAFLTEVRTGAQNDTYVEVTSGLSEQDTVIVYPSEKVSHLTRVKPLSP